MDYRRKIIMSSPHLSHAEGAVASFADGTDLPLNSLIVNIDPVQSGSGDPSPSNERPISGWSAVNVTDFVQNMWDEDWEVGTLDSSGNIKSGDNLIRSKNFCQIIGGRQYYLYSSKTDGGSQNRYYVKICFYDANKQFINGSWENRRVFTAPSNAVYFKIHTNTSVVVYGDTYNHDISVNYDSTDHDYHAYTGTSLTISLGQTVYGGTLNVLTGELTVDRAMATFDGSDDESWYAYSSYNGFNYRTLNMQVGTRQSGSANWLKVTQDSTQSNAVWLGTNNSWMYIVRVADLLTEYTVDAWRAYLAQNPLTVVYPLATPLEIQLTPNQVNSLVGQNNIFSDTGNIALDYWAHP